jgi:sugar/nucleoside kinase (ribokinase family)
MADPAIEILHVGSASRDITSEDPRGWRLGGGAAYAALTTARLGLRTAAVVGADATVAGAHELDLLRSAGVEVLVVPLVESPSFHNLEGPEGRTQICVAPGGPIPLVDLPPSWVAAAAWSIVPVAAEAGDWWVPAIPPRAIVSVGWQGWLRVLSAGQIVARREPASSLLLRRANLVGVSRHDLAPGTDLAALGRMLQPGADLLITEGDQGGHLLRMADEGVGQEIRYDAIESDAEVDLTGAGDTFLGALLGTAVRPSIVAGDQADPSWRSACLAFAAAAASLVIEDIGLLGVPDLAAVLERSVRGGGEGTAAPSS